MMMNVSQLADIVQAVAVLIVAILVCFWMLPIVRLDMLRQKLFALRDELFDYAMEGNISFDDPAYTLLRDQLNGLIRYGHNLSFYRATMSRLMRASIGKRANLVWLHSWNQALDRVKDEKVRRELNKFHHRAMMNVSKHIVTGSLILFILTIWAMLQYGISRLVRAGSFHDIIDVAQGASHVVLRRRVNPQLLEEEAVCALI